MMAGPRPAWKLGLDRQILVQLGEACLAARRVDEAETHAHDALAFSRQRGERGDEAWALLLHGEIAAAAKPGQLELARDWMRRALALSDELGMRPLAARCRMALGALELGAGHSDEAQTWLAPAVADIRAMGIVRWRAPAEALLARSKDP